MKFGEYANRETPLFKKGQLVSYKWKAHSGEISFENEEITEVHPWCRGSFYDEATYTISGAIKIFWEHEFNQRNKTVYLTILNAPTVAIGVEGCQLTGYLEVHGGVIASRDINKWVEEVKRNYTLSWKDNKEMLKFLETVA